MSNNIKINEQTKALPGMPVPRETRESWALWFVNWNVACFVTKSSHSLDDLRLDGRSLQPLTCNLLGLSLKCWCFTWGLGLKDGRMRFNNCDDENKKDIMHGYAISLSKSSFYLIGWFGISNFFSIVNG